jgi:hypothetical protein
LPIVRTLGMRPFYGANLYVAEAGKVFDAQGQLINADVRAHLTRFLEGYAQFLAHG